MLAFENDYSYGAHEAILKRLAETSCHAQTGYGSDPFCSSAKEKILHACGLMDGDVFFLTGGTQTNQLTVDTLLAPYEGVLCADTGHIATHEAGAIEFTGHKVLPLPQTNGKLSSVTVESYLSTFFSDENREHMVHPGMLYLSQPTEYGMLYTLDELIQFSVVCRSFGIKLYVDGARLGYALSSPGNNVSLADLAQLCDAFYIGGTKVGALFGEALVFPKGAPDHFVTQIKQHGALLAKGWIAGIQFDTLFTDDLYRRISSHAIEMADQMRAIFREKGYRFHTETVTNQIFVILTDEKRNALKKHISFSFWERLDEESVVVRFATSWATSPEDVEALRSFL